MITIKKGLLFEFITKRLVSNLYYIYNKSLVYRKKLEFCFGRLMEIKITNLDFKSHKIFKYTYCSIIIYIYIHQLPKKIYYYIKL